MSAPLLAGTFTFGFARARAVRVEAIERDTRVEDFEKKERPDDVKDEGGEDAKKEAVEDLKKAVTEAKVEDARDE